MNINICRLFRPFQQFKRLLYHEPLRINEFALPGLQQKIAMPALAHARLLYGVSFLRNFVGVSAAPALPCCKLQFWQDISHLLYKPLNSNHFSQMHSANVAQKRHLLFWEIEYPDFRSEFSYA